MKNTITICLLAFLLFGCAKEFLNECDEKSPAYKAVNASFSSSKSGSTISFINNSLNAEGYKWDFGDGTTSKELNPIKAYATAKAYNVVLTADRCGGERKSTLSQTFDLKCETAPPTITASSTSICAGESLTLTASNCAGIVSWSNGKTGLAITELPTLNLDFTATCTVGQCLSNKSAVKSIIVNPLAIATSLAGSRGLLTKTNDFTFNGSIDFKTISDKGSVDDHGFIYLSGTTDPLNSKSSITISLGKKLETSGTAFKTELLSQSSSQFSYRAFVKQCNGKLQYGEVVKVPK